MYKTRFKEPVTGTYKEREGRARAKNDVRMHSLVTSSVIVRMTTDRRDGSYAETLKFKRKKGENIKFTMVLVDIPRLIVAGPSVRNRYRTSRNRPRLTCQPASSLPPSTKAVLKENRATEHLINTNCKINKEQHQQGATSTKSIIKKATLLLRSCICLMEQDTVGMEGVNWLLALR
jgi:hypothetical protein